MHFLRFVRIFVLARFVDELPRCLDPKNYYKGHRLHVTPRAYIGPDMTTRPLQYNAVPIHSKSCIHGKVRAFHKMFTCFGKRDRDVV